MTIITYNTDLTTIESDGSDTRWMEIPMTGYHLFPYNTSFQIGDSVWVMEFYIQPGRYGDILSTHLLKDTDEGYVAMYDWVIKTGIEVVIDDTIRIIGFDIRPALRDNYETRKVYGTYSVAVAEVL